MQAIKLTSINFFFFLTIFSTLTEETYPTTNKNNQPMIFSNQHLTDLENNSKLTQPTTKNSLPKNPADGSLPPAGHSRGGLSGGPLGRLCELKRTRLIFMASSPDVIRAKIIFLKSHRYLIL
jgi:hypothetical protein